MDDHFHVPRGIFLLAILVGSVTGCAAEQTGSNAVTVDSAGVRIIENTVPLWRGGEEWIVDESPVLDVGGDGESSPQLFRIEDIVGLGDKVAVINAASSQVFLFDMTGRLIKRIGGRGEGPGEFTRIRALDRCGEDTLVVTEQLRVSFFDARGEFIRVQPIVGGHGNDFPRIAGIGAGCSSYAMFGNVTPPASPGPTFRRSVTYFWGDLEGGPRDTIGTFSGQELVGATIEGYDQALYLPWGIDAVYTVGRGRFYIGTTDRPEVRVYRLTTGLESIIRWQSRPREVSAEDRRTYAEKKRWLLDHFPQGQELVPELSELPRVPSFKPLFRSLLVDDEGNLWVRSYPDFIAGRPDLFDRDVPLRFNPPPGESPEVFTVFDSLGILMGHVNVPPDLIVRAVYRDQLLAVWKDDLDVEHVRVHRLLKP